MEPSILHLLQNSIQRYPDRPALMYKKSSGDYTTITYQQLDQRIHALAAGLRGWGIKSGDRIAILSNNCPEWAITDFSAMTISGIVVPIYQTLLPRQIAYILNDARVRAIFVENQEQLDKILEIQSDCPSLEKIAVFDATDSTGDFHAFSELTALGKKEIDRQGDRFLEWLDQIDPQAVSSLVYTSGTTGEPKGVMLNQHGFVFDVINAESVFPLYHTDVFLSFLPLSHLFERLAGHWCPLYRGGAIAYAESIETVIDDLQMVRPTVMVSVPRLYEKISSKVLSQIESGSAIKKKLFYWAQRVGRKYHVQKHGRWITLQYTLADKLVFSKIKAKLGGRFRFPVAGGAPLAVETLKFFEAMGLSIIEGYGMTETHLIIALTPPGNTRYGSCGPPIPGIEVKISDDGEILVRGDILMMGYYGKPDLTRESIDDEGWLHTGDIGYMDDDQYIYITDRKKNILVTAGGKNVAPAPIENALKRSQYIDDVCLIGDKRKFISAILIPNFDALTNWASEQQLDWANQDELVQLPEIHSLMEAEINLQQKDFARFEKVKKFIVLPQPLSIEQDELTPSLKIRRKVVSEHFKDEIETLYLA
ncbi:MAG: long-chain fatty acid--CoA ligase [Lentisphaeria bacterium]|nr:long-chain fatty acid--CoA ligase [Candidatus Neomarinimicrobiota bacterium]MCF7842009.1 long-chain fatty acid--CoA ligase [Lentisphaeria bacterium]